MCRYESGIRIDFHCSAYLKVDLKNLIRAGEDGATSILCFCDSMLLWPPRFGDDTRFSQYKTRKISIKSKTKTKQNMCSENVPKLYSAELKMFGVDAFN